MQRVDIDERSLNDPMDCMERLSMDPDLRLHLRMELAGCHDGFDLQASPCGPGLLPLPWLGSPISAVKELDWKKLTLHDKRFKLKTAITVRQNSTKKSDSTFELNRP